MTTRRFCVRCVEDYAEPDTLLCPMCRFEAERDAALRPKPRKTRGAA